MLLNQWLICYLLLLGTRPYHPPLKEMASHFPVGNYDSPISSVGSTSQSPEHPADSTLHLLWFGS